MAGRGFEMVRYADDFVVLCRTPTRSRRGIGRGAGWTVQAGLTLHPEKTRLVDAWNDGLRLPWVPLRTRPPLAAPEEHGEAQGRDPGEDQADGGTGAVQVIADINPTLRGWYGYFQHSHRPTFRMVDGWVRRRLRSILRRRRGRRGSHRRTAPIRHAGRMPSLPNMGCSACRTPMMRSASPLEGNTTDRRAGCGRSASPVRREGEAVPLPDLILQPQCRCGWPGQARP